MNLATVPREYREIPLGLIDEPVLPSRGSMSDEGLDELTSDIRAKGLIQPLIVARTGERYEVIAGHRRFIACGRAGLAAVPCAIYPSAAAALEAVKWSENRFREDLNAAEEAIWFAELLERDCAGDVDQLCAQLGAKRSYVEGRLLLIHGDALVFRALQDGRIVIGIAHALNKCSNELMRRYFLDAAIRGGATIALVVGWVQEYERSLGAQLGETGTMASVALTAPMPETNYFTCAVCLGTDNVHLMRPLNVHDYCKLAVLDKLLATLHGD